MEPRLFAVYKRSRSGDQALLAKEFSLMQINDKDRQMTALPFQIFRPIRQDTPVIFASPHSGRTYSEGFRRKSVLDDHRLRSSEDAYVDLLLDQAPLNGAPLITALTPRAYVDLNRNTDELDGALIHSVRNTRNNPRVASGLGVIPRVVANGRAIYRGKLQWAEAEERLRDHWHPYHKALSTLIDDTAKEFGQAILIDCHSMPHEALNSIATPGVKRPDVVIGDRFGSACSARIANRVSAAFRNAGFSVTHNVPFAGAYIVQHYGRPSQGQHALQIEIDRKLYMDEDLIQPNENFKEFQNVLTKIITEITDIGREAQALLAAE